jgi:ferrochelatase
MSGLQVEAATDRAGILLLGFGEPEGADEVEVEAFLERIFLAGASLEPGAEGGARERARVLARARAPGLTETYRRMQGSPLLPQLRAQALALATSLAARGRAVPVTVAAQFTEPSIAAAADWANTEGLDRIVALPTYPVCGPSTTLAALESLREATRSVRRLDVVRVTGWHRHPGFHRLWAEPIRRCARDASADLYDGSTLLYFSAHGTPVKYLEQVPYVKYVAEACAGVADELGIARYALGYQNHGNRPIAWTQPSNEALLPTVEAERIIVVPISFVHEQSETLDELDVDMCGQAEALGLGFHRVPVPHDHPSLVELWADLAEEALDAPGSAILCPCTCSEAGTAWCARESSRNPVSALGGADNALERH